MTLTHHSAAREKKASAARSTTAGIHQYCKCPFPSVPGALYPIFFEDASRKAVDIPGEVC